jgi:hypothetical protein
VSDESLAIDEWLYGTLTGDAALTAVVGQRVHNEQAPTTSTFPLVVFQLQSSIDVRGNGQTRIMVDALYVVRGIVANASYDANSKLIAERIDALLHASSGGTADGGAASIFTSHRTQHFRLAEEESGKQYRHLGGIYRIYAQSQ